jgi:hypothetical protein
MGFITMANVDFVADDAEAVGATRGAKTTHAP